jgi:hypothetical protein
VGQNLDAAPSSDPEVSRAAEFMDAARMPSPKSPVTLLLGSIAVEPAVVPSPRAAQSVHGSAAARGKRRGIAILASVGVVGCLVAFGLATGGLSAAKVSIPVAEPMSVRTQLSLVPSKAASIDSSSLIESAKPRRAEPRAEKILPESRAEKILPKPPIFTAPVPRRKVILQVFPYNARVYLRGLALEGPPYTVEVPIAKRVTLEVARPGYVTRRVSLDGLTHKVVVGLTRIRRPNAKRHGAAAPAAARRDGSIPVMSGL